MADEVKPRKERKKALPVSGLHKRTIAKELFIQWRQLVRKGDPEVLTDLMGVSKPTINKAIIYGHCHSQPLIDKITAFFADRLMKEREDAARLGELRKDIKPTPQEAAA